MKNIFILAQNTFREIVRERIFYILIFFALVIFGFSLALGQLSFNEQERISINFGFTAIHLSVIFLSLFLGSGLVKKEIESKTLFFILSRPVTRGQFLIAKALGLSAVSFFLNIILSLGLLASVLFLGLDIKWSFFAGVIGIFYESLILICFCIFLSTWTGPLSTFIFSINFFLVGHWLEKFKLLNKSEEPNLFYQISNKIFFFIPDLETLNWRSLFIYSESIAPLLLLKSLVYATLWCIVYLCLAQIIFSKRNLS